MFDGGEIYLEAKGSHGRRNEKSDPAMGTPPVLTGHYQVGHVRTKKLSTVRSLRHTVVLS